jgi:hypothetical protein
MFGECKELPYSDLSNLNNSSDINNKRRLKDDLDEEKFRLLFISSDQTINYSLECEKSDIFPEVEEKLYSDFPELKQKNISFFANGNIINRTVTLEENGIQNGNIILIEYN